MRKKVYTHFIFTPSVFIFTFGNRTEHWASMFSPTPSSPSWFVCNEPHISLSEEKIFSFLMRRGRLIYIQHFLHFHHRWKNLRVTLPFFFVSVSGRKKKEFVVSNWLYKPFSPLPYQILLLRILCPSFLPPQYFILSTSRKYISLSLFHSPTSDKFFIW